MWKIPTKKPMVSRMGVFRKKTGDGMTSFSSSHPHFMVSHGFPVRVGVGQPTVYQRAARSVSSRSGTVQQARLSGRRKIHRQGAGGKSQIRCVKITHQNLRALPKVKRESPTPLYISNIPDQRSFWTASALLDISALSYQFTKYTISSNSVQSPKLQQNPTCPTKKRTKQTGKQTPIDYKSYHSSNRII